MKLSLNFFGVARITSQARRAGTRSLSNRWLKFGVQALLTLVCLVFLAQINPTLAQIPVSNSEIRGVWLTNIDSDVLYAPTSPDPGQPQLHRALKRLARLNFNTIYPTVWNWGYTLYPSSVAADTIGRSVDPHPGLKGRDLLAELVQQGHRQGLTVIPWFEFGFMAPADSELARRHPDWLSQRQDGTQVVKEGRDDRVWLNPFHPQVQQFILALLSEIVQNYDVDGIQLDDHFGLPVELGYDPFTVNLYRQEHKGNPPPSAQTPEWMKWRADRLTDFMVELVKTIKTVKPDALISLSPNPQAFSYTNFLQDWFTWQRKGLIDELILQVYRQDMEPFRTELSQPEVQFTRQNIPVGIGILAGLKNRITPINLIATQVQTARQQGYAGVSFFFYETIGSDRDQDFKSLFPTPSPRP